MSLCDLGKKYGLKIPEKFIKDNLVHLSFLIDSIKSNFKYEDEVLIYDFGGGNGLLAKSLLNELKEYNLKIVIIDSDDSKFIKHPNIKNIKTDLVKFNSKEKADYSIIRNVFHYNTFDKNLEILEKIYSLTNNRLLYINMFILKSEESYYEKHANFLKKWFDVYRSYPSLDDLEKVLKNAGWTIYRKNEIKSGNFDFIEFSKKRYNLNSDQIKELKKAKLNKINSDNTAIFFCKK